MDTRYRYEKAVSLNPNDEWGYFNLAKVLRNVGQFDKATLAIKKAMRLNPHHPWGFPHQLGRNYYHLRRYDDGIAVFEEVLEMCTEGGGGIKWPYVQLSHVYAELGQLEKARFYRKY